MSIKLQLPKLSDLKPRITVVGVGGAGGNAVNNMIASGLTGVEFIVANTDAQALAASSAERRIQLGANLTEGLGAGSKPEIGQAAAEEALDEIRAHIAGSHMVFIAAGMGGGTGTGAAAVIARIARELGILTVGVVTKPFQFEGTRRMRAAEAGIAELKKHVDTLIVIPNQNLFRIANDRTTFADAFVLADQVLYSGVACIVDLIVKEGLINLDFADVRTIMSGMGTAMMGTGEASGDQRAIRAAEEAIANPLVDGVSLDGAKGLLLSIIGGPDMTLFEVDEAASRVRREVDPDANIIVGATFDDTMGDRIRVAIVASGMEALNTAAAAPARAPAFDPPSDVQAPRAQPARAQPPAIPGAAAAPPTAPPPAHPQRRSAFDILVAEATETDDRPAYLTAMPQSSPPPLPQAHTSRELWRAPGNVIIEEAPATMSAPAERRAPPSLASAPPAAVFSPAAPAEAARNARRVPDIGEFPAVGQREYNARNLLAAHANRPSPPAAGSASAQAAPERRGGLLDRLVGAGQNGPAQAGQNGGASASVAAQSSDAKASPPGRAMPFFFNRNKG